MPLTQCPECKSIVSDHADRCPTCGCPSEIINKLEEIPSGYATTVTENTTSLESHKCSGCGRALSVTSIFCPTCGKQVLDPPKPNSKFKSVNTEFSICPDCQTEYSYPIDHCVRCGFSTTAYKNFVESLLHTEIPSHYGPVRCPFCRSDNVTATANGDFSHGYGKIVPKNYCLNCGHTWKP